MTLLRQYRLLPRAAIVFVLNLFFVFPVLLANVPYKDDTARILYGFGWIRAGRVLSTGLMNLLDLRARNLADLSPLGQIVGLAVLSLSAVFLARRITRQDNPDVVALCLCGLPLAVHPFFLENLCYHYDALPMLLAQSCAVMAVSLPRILSPGRRLGLGALLLFGILSFYQPCLNTFLALSIVLFIVDCRDDNCVTAWRELALSVGAFLLGSLPYHFLVEPFVHGEYAANHAVRVSFSTFSFHGFWQTHREALWLLGSILTGGAKPLLAGFYLVGTGYGCVIVFRCLKRRGLAASTASLVVFLAPGFLLVLLSGLMLSLQQPVYEPRTFVAFSVCIIFAVLVFIKGRGRWRLVGFIPSVYFFVLAYAFGNALHEQARLENIRLAQLAIVLEDAGFEPGDDLFLYGHEPRPPAVRNAITIFPIIDRLLPRQGLDDNNFFGYAMLTENGVESREHTLPQWEQARHLVQQPYLVHRTAHYALYRQGHSFCLDIAPS